jgi:hypothetical protein
VSKGAKQYHQKQLVGLFSPFTHTTFMLLLILVVLFSPFTHTTCMLLLYQDHQKQHQHECGVSKGAKQDHQKQQRHECGVSKGTKQDHQKQQ